ncbi:MULTISPECIES: BrnA antitoxin family protein [Microvirga]|uniref:BrnA antitoxin family protein n=1 Tax=Microvirga TaxID=186650 RepID=UPI001CFD820E|nr:BrnA antitoxin family protein [Microvirga lenta]MCB5173713.1 BrnA antitoxin family protein [Microvirga lenta]
MDRERIVRHVASLDDGTSIVEHEDGRLERLTSRTDWARIDALSDEEIEAAATDDPDETGFQQIDWSKAEVASPPRKLPISIRVDEDVLNFFKQQGTGYQRRMNAVLRAYMKEARKAGPTNPKAKKAG